MTSAPQIMTIAQWAHGAPWRLTLPHSQPQHALIWITRGQARAAVGGLRRGVGAHNALAVPAGTLFSLDIGPGCYGQVCLIPPGGPALMPDEPEHLRIREAQTQSELTALLEALTRETTQARPFSDEAAQALAIMMTVWLRRAMIAQEPGPQPTAAQRLVIAYAALVEQCHASGQPMAAYARDLGVTPTHLGRSCKACSGLTASDLLVQRILHAARELLEDGEDAILHVAARLGFGSAAYFSRFIHAHTGLSPSALRRKAQAA
ncbi:AraC family transcriptional regulator [Roseovarius dicentrarchi]|uniref:AraC family transcriptional regulator n=1 Tax=Roseovarius dicentrarchi TaxID=2250573 RepID=UPI001EF13998|nr:helix-turn-helix domain-containing protein [Roseovarius dicentrarchi]